MESQIAELTAQVAALQSSAGVTNTGFAEVFYYLSIPLMIIIHAGFLAYEMGRRGPKMYCHQVLKLACICVYDTNLLLLWLVGILGFSYGINFQRGS